MSKGFTLKWYPEKFKKEVDDATFDKIVNGAKLVLKDAERTAPVGTIAREGNRGYKRRKPGTLRKSGRISTFRNEDGSGAYIKFGGRGHIVDGVDTYYAIFVELTGKPFLRMALKRNRNKIYKSLKNIV